MGATLPIAVAVSLVSSSWASTQATREWSSIAVCRWQIPISVGKAPTAREQRDEVLLGETRRVHADNYAVYEALKVWLQVNPRASRSPAAPWSG